MGILTRLKAALTPSKTSPGCLTVPASIGHLAPSVPSEVGITIFPHLCRPSIQTTFHITEALVANLGNDAFGLSGRRGTRTVELSVANKIAYASIIQSAFFEKNCYWAASLTVAKPIASKSIGVAAGIAYMSKTHGSLAAIECDAHGILTTEVAIPWHRYRLSLGLEQDLIVGEMIPTGSIGITLGHTHASVALYGTDVSFQLHSVA